MFMTAQQQITTDVMNAPRFRERFGHALHGFTFNFPGEAPDCHYIASRHDDALAGFIKFGQTQRDLYMSYIEVKPGHQGKGLSGRMLERLFGMAADTDRSILMSGFTPMGQDRLSRHIVRLQRQYPAVAVAFE